MPVSIQVGQSGTLRFMPESAGLDPALVSNVSWQPQGSQQHVKFHPPDQVEGLSVGTGSYRALVTLQAANEKYTFPFDVQCNAPTTGPPVMTPVTIDLVPTPMPTGAQGEKTP